MKIDEFVSAWLLGILTISMTNDNDAIVRCRMLLLDLKRELENLRRSQKYPHRRENADVKKINTIKTILESLNIHHAGLFIKYPKFQQCIDDSLKLIAFREDSPDNPENYTPFVGVHLGSIWGETDHLYKASKIKDMQTFFHAGFLKRLLIRIKEAFCTRISFMGISKSLFGR